MIHNIQVMNTSYHISHGEEDSRWQPLRRSALQMRFCNETSRPLYKYCCLFFLLFATGPYLLRNLRLEAKKKKKHATASQDRTLHRCAMAGPFFWFMKPSEGTTPPFPHVAPRPSVPAEGQVLTSTKEEEKERPPLSSDPFFRRAILPIQLGSFFLLAIVTLGLTIVACYIYWVWRVQRCKVRYAGIHESWWMVPRSRLIQAFQAYFSSS